MEHYIIQQPSSSLSSSPSSHQHSPSLTSLNHQQHVISADSSFPDVDDKDFINFYLGFSDAGFLNNDLISPPSPSEADVQSSIQDDDGDVSDDADARVSLNNTKNENKINNNNNFNAQSEMNHDASESAMQLQNQFIYLLKYQKQLQEQQMMNSKLINIYEVTSSLDGTSGEIERSQGKKLHNNNLSYSTSSPTATRSFSIDKLQTATIAAYEAAIKAGASEQAAREVAEQAIHIALSTPTVPNKQSTEHHTVSMLTNATLIEHPSHMPALVPQSNGSTPLMRSPCNSPSVYNSDNDLPIHSHFWQEQTHYRDEDKSTISVIKNQSNKRQKINNGNFTNSITRHTIDGCNSDQDNTNNIDSRCSDIPQTTQFLDPFSNTSASTSAVVTSLSTPSQNVDPSMDFLQLPSILSSTEHSMQSPSNQVIRIKDKPIHITNAIERASFNSSIGNDNANSVHLMTNHQQDQISSRAQPMQVIFVPLASSIRPNGMSNNQIAVMSDASNESTPKNDNPFHYSQSPLTKLPSTVSSSSANSASSAAEIRMRSACDSCTKLKVKCFDKESGICFNCSKYGHKCIFSPQRKRGPPVRNRFKSLESHNGLKFPVVITNSFPHVQNISSFTPLTLAQPY